MNHAECPSKFSVPRDKGMHGCTPIDILESVVATFDDMKQSARGAAPRIVLGSE
jgi:hypothetical protein